MYVDGVETAPSNLDASEHVSWIFKYRHGGTAKSVGLGSFADVGMGDAIKGGNATSARRAAEKHLAAITSWIRALPEAAATT